jgi:hypothetical protein
MTGRDLLSILNRLSNDQIEQPVIIRGADGIWRLLEYVESNKNPISTKVSPGNYIQLS